ncbi:MAG: tetratricopeptide repeat protein [Flavobacteriales bacterium]|nr:tetratricopeptide repeat protein [Flavobacteriales bacterium]
MDIDSLRLALHTATDDTSYARASYYLARNHYFLGEMDSVRRYGELGTERCLRGGDPDARKEFWLAQLWRIRGMGWYSASRFDSAIVAFQNMYRYAEKRRIAKDMGAALSYQGFALREIDDQPGALNMVWRAIAVLDTLPPGPDIANAYHELGALHSDLGRTDSALHWYGKASELYTAQGNDHHLVNALINMGEALHKAGRWAEADSVQRATHELLPALSDPMIYNRWVAGEARMLIGQGQHQEATHLLDSALGLAKQMEDHNAQLHLLQLRSLARVQAGRISDAYLDQQAAIAAHAEDMGLEKIRATEKAQSDFEHEKTIALGRADYARQRLQKWGAVIIGGLALLLAFVWYRSFKVKSRLAEALRVKNEEIQCTQAQLVASEKRREAEQVRTRIARDIHDEIGATLTKIRLLSDVAATNTPEQLPDTQRSLQRIGAHVRHVSGAMSDIVWAVDPARDTHQGMLDHVRELSRRLLGDNGITFDLDLSCTVGIAVMEPDLRRDLHLLINEAYNNILKYAKAKHVRTRLKLNSYLFELDIEDDGIGFDPSLVHGAGNGLRNMRERAARYEGKLRISSEPGKGTRITGEGRF